MRPLLLLAITLLATAVHAQTLKLQTTIPLPDVTGRIDHMTYDPATHRLFIAALGNGSLEVIDLEKSQRIASIKNLKEPQGVAIISNPKRIVVGCGGDGTIRFFDDHLKPITKIEDRDDADNVRSIDGTAYVGFGTGAIAIVTDAHVDEVKLAAHPESFQLEQNGPRIFVNVPNANRVAVVDREQRKVLATWPINYGANFPMALDEPNHRLYIGCRRPAKLVAIDIETGKEIAASDCVADADDLFVDHARQRIYVIGGGGAVNVFDVNSLKQIDVIQTTEGARTGLWIEPRRQLIVAVPRSGNHTAELRVYAN